MNNRAKKVIKLNESQLRQVIRESIVKMLKEGGLMLDPSTSIEGTIWSDYNIPWNEVWDDTNELTPQKGKYIIEISYADYTRVVGSLDIPQKFNSIEDCCSFIENYTREQAAEYFIENGFEGEEYDQWFDRIGFEIRDSDNRTVAITKWFVPDK